MIFVSQFNLIAQESQIDYSNPKQYTIADITVTGTQYLDKNTLVSISGLSIGQEIIVPGEDLSNSIRKLWSQGLFADVSINMTKIIDTAIYLNIHF